MNILFTVERIGPYHDARFGAISNLDDFDLNVLEFDSFSERYPWKEKINKKYKVHKLSKTLKNKFRLNIKKEIDKILKYCKPDIIFISGWDHKSSYYLIFVANLQKIPIVIISDSRYKDAKRNFLIELVKKFLLKGCSSALVAGIESEKYITKLGFKKSNIFKPYDVIDNDFFCSNNFQKNKIYILCVARFIEKKNHLKLIKAFASYKNNGGKLNLILIGEGPEKEKILSQIKTLSCSSSITIKKWQEIRELKEYYLKAKAFVLFSKYDQWGLVVNEAMASGIPCIVSTECGCYQDLVKNKNTGWGVDPSNEEELTKIFHKIDNLKEKEIIKIKNNIHQTIKNYDLKSFSKAIVRSSLNAIKNRKSSRLSTFTAYILFLLK